MLALSVSTVLEGEFWRLLSSLGQGLLAIADYLGVHPVHLALEIFFGLVLIYFIFQKSYKIKHDREALTDKVFFSFHTSIFRADSTSSL